MKKIQAKKAAQATGRGLVTALSIFGEALVLASEEQERQRKIQEHTDALKTLQPEYDIMLVHKA